MSELTPKTAYVAMILFLEKFYRRTHSDDVGGLLGDMSLLTDGTPADAAAWNEWMECVERVQAGKVGESDVRLRLNP